MIFLGENSTGNQTNFFVICIEYNLPSSYILNEDEFDNWQEGDETLALNNNLAGLTGRQVNKF